MPKRKNPERARFAESDRVDALAAVMPDVFRVFECAQVTHRGTSFPIFGVVIGSEDRTRPTFGLFGGVHGVERVGTHVVLTFLESVAARLRWDKDLRRTLRKTRIVSMPMVNPVGVYARTRSNGRGVDLMRNAPVEAERSPPWLVGGHRISRHLPWYRGSVELEAESRALVDFVRTEMFPSRAALGLDIHSGFGMRDRLWYPYAKTRRPISRMDDVLALARLLDRTHPHHVYLVEAQSESYTTHGDLWDYLFDSAEAEREPSQLFLPFTLEIGSWRWIKKDPTRIFSRSGPFNPMTPHRYDRTMRRHLLLLDFFLRAARNHRAWRPGNVGVDQASRSADPSSCIETLDSVDHRSAPCGAAEAQWAPPTTLARPESEI
ncbi:MAG: DUF2817 domain-containing protein [Deltaproteobacteria bacterium]|nr:DUF2817 domain-containing protein [Deltaproteobacteria bacterium]